MEHESSRTLAFSIAIKFRKPVAKCTMLNSLLFRLYPPCETTSQSRHCPGTCQARHAHILQKGFPYADTKHAGMVLDLEKTESVGGVAPKPRRGIVGASCTECEKQSQEDHLHIPPCRFLNKLFWWELNFRNIHAITTYTTRSHDGTVLIVRSRFPWERSASPEWIVSVCLDSNYHRRLMLHHVDANTGSFKASNRCQKSVIFKATCMLKVIFPRQADGPDLGLTWIPRLWWRRSNFLMANHIAKANCHDVFHSFHHSVRTIFRTLYNTKYDTISFSCKCMLRNTSDQYNPNWFLTEINRFDSELKITIELYWFFHGLTNFLRRWKINFSYYSNFVSVQIRDSCFQFKRYERCLHPKYCAIYIYCWMKKRHSLYLRYYSLAHARYIIGSDLPYDSMKWYMICIHIAFSGVHPLRAHTNGSLSPD